MRRTGFSQGYKLPSRWLLRCDELSQADPFRSHAKPNRLADGPRRSLSELTLPILRRHVAGFFALREKEIVQALQFAHERLRFMIKPSSVAALFLSSSKSFNLSASRSA